MSGPARTAMKSGESAYRDSTPDAVFGAVLAMEAMLGIMARSWAIQSEVPNLLALRLQVETALRTRQATTKFGTGEAAIADGVRDSLDSIFSTAGFGSTPPGTDLDLPGSR